MKSPSIRRTLLVRCGIGVGALLCVLSVTIYLVARQSLYREMDESITQTAALVGNQVELEHGKVVFEWQEGLGTNKSLILDELFQFWNETTGETTRSPALGKLDLPKFTGHDGNMQIRSIRLPNGERGRAVGIRVHPYVLPEEMEKMRERGEVIDPLTLPHTLVVAESLESLYRTLEQLRYILISGTLLTLGLGFTLIDHVIRITLRPIDHLIRQMRDRTENQLDSALQLPPNLPSEISGLAGDFDTLLARVAATRQRERDFLRHAAHELRTPIAGLQATAELALSKPRDSETYTNYLESCRKTAGELGTLVTRLSALARIGSPSATPLHTESLSPCELVDELLPTFRATAARRGVLMNVEAPDISLRFTGDRTFCRIVLNNLFDNAACYAPDNSTVRIQIGMEHHQVVISVSNPAMALKEDPARLFEPLFRCPDTAPGDPGSHLGIGLALSLDAANAMGGTLMAHKTTDGWIEFRFGLPAASS